MTAASRGRLTASAPLSLARTAPAAAGLAVLLAAAPPPGAAAGSVARDWNEALLDAIRADTPRPTVHARNLFHTSAAVYDAWSAFDAPSAGFLVDTSFSGAFTASDRDEAISHAAYGLLTHRFTGSPAGERALSRFDTLMADLGHDASNTSVGGNSAAALGNRIAASYVAYGLSDGANEANDYADTSGYAASNPPLVVAEGIQRVDDPDRWQPLTIQKSGAEKTQAFLTPHWGGVATFAAERPDGGGPFGSDFLAPPPVSGSEAFKAAVVDVIRTSQKLDAGNGALVNLSPRLNGNNTLGTQDGTGHAVNPSTGEAYADNLVAEGDFGRVLAEFWADGPTSSTPPGHWNEIAHDVADHPSFERRFGGTGPVLSDLEWDVKSSLILNGAAHDSGVAAWDLKREVDYVRPISMIRHMGRLGQSSDPEGPSFDPGGLPLEAGLIEVVTAGSSAAGGRHEGLGVGTVAVNAWRGFVNDDDTPAGVGWIAAEDWLPYQAEDFVTPGFSGYVSGHSTFSRAMAEVLAESTGDEYFPGGLGEFNFELGRGLGFESGPAADVNLQWATYFDAADEAGLSRIYGGIHVAADDFDGRLLGHRLGQDAFAFGSGLFSANAQVVPTPSALSAGLVGLAVLLRRHRRRE